MVGSETPKRRASTFDYRILRLLVGAIAFAIPIVVIELARPTVLDSISASYYTAARDAFVGLLFVVAAFLVAYRGYTSKQGAASTVGGVAAAIVATFPTSSAQEPDVPSAPVHYLAAAVLFLILAYFCYVFWRQTHASESAVARRRSRIYAACGIVMLACIVGIAGANLFFGGASKSLRVTFWGETIALLAFGTAWIVAGKALPFLSTHEERPVLLADLRGFLMRRRTDDEGVGDVEVGRRSAQ